MSTKVPETTPAPFFAAVALRQNSLSRISPTRVWAIDRIALGPCQVTRGAGPTARRIPPCAMAKVASAIDKLNQSIVNGYEDAGTSAPGGQTWYDLFSSEKIVADHQELWIKRAQGGGIAGYAAVKVCPTRGVEMGLLTIAATHRGQGLAKELIAAIVGAHPLLHLYVGERNVRAQNLYQSLAEQGFVVCQMPHKFYDNGERALGLVIRRHPELGSVARRTYSQSSIAR